MNEGVQCIPSVVANVSAGFIRVPGHAVEENNNCYK